MRPTLGCVSVAMFAIADERSSDARCAKLASVVMRVATTQSE
jgi:hypothetical protein